jgi:hypothetical protein
MRFQLPYMSVSTVDFASGKPAHSARAARARGFFVNFLHGYRARGPRGFDRSPSGEAMNFNSSIQTPGS